MPAMATAAALLDCQEHLGFHSYAMTLRTTGKAPHSSWKSNMKHAIGLCGLLSILSVGTVLAAADESGDLLWRAGRGVIEVRLDLAAIRESGLDLILSTSDQHDVDPRRDVVARVDDGLRFEVGSGNIRALAKGEIETSLIMRAGAVEIADRLVTPIKLRTGAKADLTMLLVDDGGMGLLQLDHVHGTIDWRDRRFLAENMDVRITDAFARRLGRPALSGRTVGLAHVRLPFQIPKAAPLIPDTCASPQWPDQSGRNVDVRITSITSLQVDCVTVGQCDGEGRSEKSKLKFTPSVELTNVGTADVPWFTKFTRSPFDYPYSGNDQHPYLVWNIYRLDPDGALVPLGESGAKHAVVSTNLRCNCANNHLLGIGCVDHYGKSNNDNNIDLGPRAEIVPHTGQWGRCGSVFDRDCDGAPDGRVASSTDDRLLASEAAFARRAYPGSRYFIETWYVVRDDNDIDNSISVSEFQPRWAERFWKADLVGNITNGPLLARWRDLTKERHGWLDRRVITPIGQVIVVSQVKRAGDHYRYRVALQNLDFARATLISNEPNLRVDSSAGIAGISIESRSMAGLTVSMISSDSYLQDIGAPTVMKDALHWPFKPEHDLTWGKTIVLEFISPRPPKRRAAKLLDPNGETSYSTVVLAP